MLKIVGIILFSVIVNTSFAQSIDYKLTMENPNNHYFGVEMTLSDFGDEFISVKMPVWAPGSYLVREFSKNLNIVHAENENGDALPIEKTSKNEWKIKRNKAKKVIVKYDVYAFELTVRTSFLDNTHGFVSGSGVFMYVDGYKDFGGSLSVVPHKSFSTVTTALKPTMLKRLYSDGSQVFDFEDYDNLVDCPIEIGNQEVFSFTAAGVEHTVAMYGVGNYDVATLKTDMVKIIESATAVFGQNPNEKYTFIIHNVVDGQGGLEHKNSTTLSVNRWTYEGDDYLGFLSLVAHEYFHLWNVKRIRPIELGPFNYDEENYTSLLWVMEGFTSYYDELILRRAGFYTEQMYLNKLMSTLNYVEGGVGAKVQPVAHASYDAWIKAYRPNENSSNTTVSYYSKGSLMAVMIDAMIIRNSKGKKCLDDFMQKLYEEFYVKMDRGFTEEEFKNSLENMLGENLDEFFTKYIHGVETPVYNDYFAPIGLNVIYDGVVEPSTGISTSNSGGKVIVKRVVTNSPSEKAGLSVNDEIIAVNGFRVNKQSFNEFISAMPVGLSVEILYSRDNLLKMTSLTMEEIERPHYSESIGTGKQTEKLRNYWLRADE